LLLKQKFEFKSLILFASCKTVLIILVVKCIRLAHYRSNKLLDMGKS
ncbi:hypothetical protein Bhyg_01153, partial [Pseudolycoriella hygida]